MTVRKKKKKIRNIKKVEGKKRFKKILLGVIVICFCIASSVLTYYFVNMGKVSDNNKLKEITINEGSITSVAKTLKENNLIRNITVFKLYIKLSGNSNLKAGIYELSEDMGTKKIIDILNGGSKVNKDEISITFKEGINIRKYANLISENTNNSYDNVMEVFNDSEYINSLIEKYWFLTDDIKNNDIYYSLEGYLYPETYRFINRDVSVKDIIEKMLNETDKKLSKYKKEIEDSKYNIHEIMTLASIVELEGAKASDRKAVAGVFINRLNSSSYPTLGSDATTYYASKIDDWSYSLTYKELNDCSNKYNTRCSKNTGLPIGPICNPSIESIEAVIEPEEHNYYYFVADCKGNVYLSENETKHYNIINKLKREDNWCA